MRRVLLVCVALGSISCVGAYDGLHAAASGGRTAVAIFESQDSAYKRKLLDAHQECLAVPDPAGCFDAVLVPYRAKRDPVLKAVDDLTPVVLAGEKVIKQGVADKSVTATLISQILNFTTKLQAAIAAFGGAQ